MFMRPETYYKFEVPLKKKKKEGRNRRLHRTINSKLGTDFYFQEDRSTFPPFLLLSTHTKKILHTIYKTKTLKGGERKADWWSLRTQE